MFGLISAAEKSTWWKFCWDALPNSCYWSAYYKKWILSLTDTTHCFITLERGHLDNACQEVKEMTPRSVSICHKYEHVQVDGDYKLQWCNSSTFSPSLWKYRLWKYCFKWCLVKKSWLMEKFRLKEGFSLRK